MGYIDSMAYTPRETRAEKRRRLAKIGRAAASDGGTARAKALSAARRSEIARAAAKARWGEL